MISNGEIGELIKTLREDSHLKQDNLAKAIGVSKAAVSQWESGKGIKTENIYLISKLFNVSVDDILNGHLNSESNEEYINRYYTLENYDFKDEINEDNIDELKNFYSQVKKVKSRFFELLPKWAENSLSFKEMMAFIKIKQYFKFDCNYYSFIKYGSNHFGYPLENDEKEFVKTQVENVKQLKLEEKKWEISKLYDFVYDLKRDKVCDSHMLEPLKLMLDVVDQSEKDYLLNNNFYMDEEIEVPSLFGGEPRKEMKKREVTYKEIESRAYFKIMLNSGCNCFLKFKTCSMIDEEETFLLFEGLKKEIDDIKKQENYNKFFNYSISNELDIIRNWKAYSLQQYNSFIDYKKTRLYKAIVNYKDSNPKMYFEELCNYYENN